MKQETVGLTKGQRLRLFDRLLFLGQLVVQGRIPFGEVMRVMRDLVSQYALDALPGEEEPEREHDLAEDRRVEMERWYHEVLGAKEVIFKELRIPKPEVSNREYRRRRKAGQELFS